MKILKKSFEYILIIILSVFSSLNYAIFIFPNKFAPSGIDGICTMIQDITNLSMGYLALLINIPLLIAAFVLLGKEFSLKTMVYVLSFSLSTVILSYIDISKYVYHSDNSIALAPIAAGAVRGIIYVYTLKLNGTSGGADIIGAIYKHFRPHHNLMNIIFVINMLIALSSYFVYGFKPEPVICSIIYAFITTFISNNLRDMGHKMVKYEIISSDGNDICNEIFKKLHRTATIMEAQGAYSGSNKDMIICVIEQQKVHDMESILKCKSDTVYFSSAVSDTYE